MKKVILLATTIFYLINHSYAQPGKLAPSFGNNGVVKADLGKNYTYPASPVTKILPQPDGCLFCRGLLLNDVLMAP